MDLFPGLPAPFAIEAMYGKAALYLVALLIGFAFGYLLEMGGFGNSKKLAAQFYLHDMTVFKVMFTGILVAMVLIFATVGLGWLEFNRVSVNLTYLWPGIVGGLIMGVGFIVGGFCPGTSLVAVATFKKDGMFFVLGLLVGIFAFGESIDALFSDFWNSSNMGRFTLPELFGLPVGVVVLAIVAGAVGLFWLVEKVERWMGGASPAPSSSRLKWIGAVTLIAAAAVVMLIGQPTSQEKWERIAAQKQPLLDSRSVQIHPAELLAYIDNDQVEVIMLDLRAEKDFNLFHLQDAQRVTLSQLPSLVKTLLQMPANTLFVTMSNDEGQATEAWKLLVAESLTNVYILEGGINHWLDTFNIEPNVGVEGLAVAMLPRPRADVPDGSDFLRYDFPAALGSQYPAAAPEPHNYELEYTPKVKLQVKQVTGGG
ncbi:MAG TPA: YeeE/YedE thiosulfate transporter family protein [Anaerolineae bacterium]|nr:YeeE/YedE thiosulfate transporter family protein [Anaerolineae bacterium]